MLSLRANLAGSFSPCETLQLLLTKRYNATEIQEVPSHEYAIN